MGTTDYTNMGKYIRLKDFVVERIEALCKFNGMSKYKLCMQTGVAQSSMSTMMSGKTLPSLGTLDRLCYGLGISIFEFFNSDSKTVKFTSQERVMLRYWNRLDERQRVAAVAFMKGMLASSDIKELAD